MAQGGFIIFSKAKDVLELFGPYKFFIKTRTYMSTFSYIGFRFRNIPNSQLNYCVIMLPNCVANNFSLFSFHGITSSIRNLQFNSLLRIILILFVDYSYLHNTIKLYSDTYIIFLFVLVIVLISEHISIS